MENYSRLRSLASEFNAVTKKEYQITSEEMSFAEYFDKVNESPKLIRTAYQRLYDMIIAKGTTKFKKYRKTLTHYKFFDEGECPIFGLDETIEELVKFMRGAACGYGAERRVLLLHGPVGSSKSTICRLIKRGMERYSKTPEGAWYSYKWVNLPTGKEGIYTHDEDDCPMHEDPIKLLPLEVRVKVLKDLNELLAEQEPDLPYKLVVEGELNPRCKFFMTKLMDMYEGDWEKVLNEHIRVVRKVYSEANRCGIATFQPKDEKNQDSTELTGDIDYSKLPFYGADSDSRSFNFDGEFCRGNRGVIEFIEMLKLAKEFLYDLLGASQEKQIKPKKFSQISIDEVIIGHTNSPEFQKLKNDDTMEALRDRTVKIDVPYQLSTSVELKILQNSYNPTKIKQHIAPHTLEVAALWAVLTRLYQPKSADLDLVQKSKLYDGKSLPGWTEDRVKELKLEYEDEGMGTGVSPRYTQDKISASLSDPRHSYISPFIIMNALKEGLEQSSLISNKEDIGRYRTCIDLAMKELDEILKNEVQKALVGDEDAIIRLCTNYIDNLMAYVEKTKIIDQYTGKEQEPDERLMREVEEKIDVPNRMVDDFRRTIAGFIGGLHYKGEKFAWDSNDQLKKAFQLKLFEDTRHHIKLSALNAKGASVVDKNIQEKIDAIKQRLITNYGYNEQSATDVLDYVGSIFARGTTSDD